MKKARHIPPRWASRFLEWYCKPSLYEDLHGDLLEYFERNVEKRGGAYAKLIYVVDVFKFFRLYTVQKPGFMRRFNQMAVFGNYFKTAVRSMARNRMFTGISVTGLAVSMTVGLFMISLLNEIYSYDNFHQKGSRIYRLVNETELGGEMAPVATTSILAGTRAAAEIPGIEKIVFFHDFKKDIKAGENAVELTGSFAGADFFSVFSFELLEGNPATALIEPFSIVLSESAARKLFGNTRAIGQVVETSDKESYKVTGIVRDTPSNSHLHFDCLASWSTYIKHEVKKRGDTEWWMHWQTMWETNVYLLLEKNASASSVQANLNRIAAEENAKTEQWMVVLSIQPLVDIMHEDKFNQDPVLDQTTVQYMLLLSIFVIFSACFNYTNLSIARALRRAKEVGVRKVIGASRMQVVVQFLLEAVVVSLFSLVLAVGLFYLLKAEFIQFIESFTSVRLSLPVMSAGIYFLILAILVGLGSGLLPALLFSRLKALNVLKGAFTQRRSGGIQLHKALVVFQYSLSITFIIGASLVYKQYVFSTNFDLGYNTSNILNIDLQGNKPEVVKNELEKIASVSQISFSGLVNSVGSTWGLQLDPAHGESIHIFYNSVDENYLEMYRHTFLAGENFHHLSANAGLTPIIINERLLQKLGIADPHEAIGITASNDLGDKKMVIVGVVKDFHYDTVHDPIEPFAYTLMPRYRFINLVIDASPLQAMDEIDELWNRIDKIHALKASFHDQRIQETYLKYSALSAGIGFLAIISISIASLGLLGMVIFTTETRLKEISIRKVLGAKELQLVKLLGKGFMGLLLVATFIAVPLAWYLGNEFFLQEFTYKTSFGFLDLFAGVILIFMIAVFAIGTQTLKAARTNPAQILRNE